MKPDRAAPARDRVLFLLKSRGAQTCAQIAARLHITEVAVRQHLRRLEDEGLVECVDQRRAVGRPARVFAITAQAHQYFPNTHADLSVEIIGSIRRVFGEEGLDRLIADRSRRQLQAYREQAASETSIERRIHALAEARSDEGYMASVGKAEDGSYLLIENHCPICIAAASCQGLCREELSTFQKFFGKAAEVDRTEHLLAGARRCAYRVTPSRRGSGQK